jgi:hypothetical protein
MGTNFESWFQLMRSLLKQEGVEYFGSVNHSVLATAFTNAGFL